MRILVNALSARKGGIVTYTNNLLTALERRGIDAIVCVPREFTTGAHAAVHRIDIGGYGPIRRFVWEQTAWRGLVNRFNPDILFSSANFGLLKSPVKQVLLLREGGLFDPFYLSHMTATQGVGYVFNRYFRRKLMLLSARSADHIITPTRAMRDMLAKWEPTLPDKCTVNPYGTIANMFVPNPHHRTWRADGLLRLLYVSVYYPHKVPSLVCQAVDGLIASGIPARARITMTTGEFKDMSGSTLDAILVGEAASRGVVELGHHEYSRLPDLYTSHDIFVFPSVSETFGHPMAEAMSSGMPLVVADTAVNREICGPAALYFPPFSVSGLIAAVRRLDGDPALRAQLSEAGRRRVVERFGWEDHVDRLVQTFESVLHGQRPASAEWDD